MEHASTIDVGTRKNRSGGINEDSIATAVFENHHRQTSRPVGVFVLGDGVGGEASGDVASFLATTTIRKSLTDALLGTGTDVRERFDLEAYPETPPTVDDDERGTDGVLTEGRIRDAIQDAIDEAHSHVQAFAKEIGGRPATTIVVGVYFDGKLHYAWVGDSRAYVVNTHHDRIQQLTSDHAVTNQLLEEGEIDDEVYARVHEDATAITNVIGGSPYGDPEVDVDFGSIDVYSEDVVLVTSDGLVDAFPEIGPLRHEYEQADDVEPVRQEILDTLVTDDEIRDTVLDAEDLHAAVEDLVTLANERGGKDNLSVTLFQDPSAEPTPGKPPTRGVDAHRDPNDTLTTRETVVEPGEDDGAEDGDADDGEVTDDEDADDATGAAHDAAAEDDPLAAGEPPAAEPEATAAVVIGGHDTIYEIEPGFTVGRWEEGADENPNIGLDVETDDIDRPHARFEREEGGEWQVRDLSDAGTYVGATEGEWASLTGDDAAPGETQRLRNGMAIRLQSPEADQPVTLWFFDSVDQAQETVGDAGGGNFVERFL